MQLDPSDTRRSRPSPTTSEIIHVWRDDRSVKDGSAYVYLRWIRRFRAYCDQRGLHEQAQLTLYGARRFVDWYSRRHDIGPDAAANARTAVHELNRVYCALGREAPPWRVAPVASCPATGVLRAYTDHLIAHRGSPQTTVHKRLIHMGYFLEHLRKCGQTWRSMTLVDIDTFLVDCSHRYARTTTADIAGSIRSFARFLIATGRSRRNLADSVIAPVQPKYERPRRALPWEDVQRLLHAVSRSNPCGLRDYAILLMMSTYGFGAGEVIGLRLDDINWSAATFRVIRPKTGTAFTLPLLPAVARALALYLRDGRPPHATTRYLFLQCKLPFAPLTCASAVRHIVVKHATVAGLTATYLGSHVLRHSNASRQIDLGADPQVVSDILGHRDPDSISAYIRIATESLRDVSLPVPS
ncbi:Tyrosine recombinase XerD [compost metagenome]